MTPIPIPRGIRAAQLDRMRKDAGLLSLNRAPLEGRPPSKPVAYIQPITRHLLDDPPALTVVVTEMAREVYREAAYAGCRYVGPLSLAYATDQLWFPEDPRSRWQRLRDWINRRTWTPPPPPVVLRLTAEAV